MKAVRYYGPGNLAVEEVLPPLIRPGEVLVRVNTCGICATDVKTYQRGHPKIQPGSVLGHEVAGQVVEVNGSSGWEPGQRVVVAPYVPCGECDHCQRSQFTLCDRLFEEALDPGGFAGFVRVPRRLVGSGLVAIPGHLPDEIACFSEPVACCLHGLEALELGPGDTLLIIGDGPMGLLQALTARAIGVRQILLSGVSARRLELAGRLVDRAIDASREDVDREVRKLAPRGADRVMVSVGDPAIAEQALSHVRKGGLVNIFGGMPKGARISIDPNVIHYDEVRLVGSFGFAPAHFRQALDYLAAGRIDPARLISDIVDFDHVRQALDAAADYQGIKYILRTDG